MHPVSVLAITLGLGCALSGAAWAGSHNVATGAEIAGDAEQGARVFRKCAACHQVGPEAAAHVGPSLNGVVGRAAGTSADFNYSPALLDAATTQTLIWTPANLDAFLTKPKDFIEGTKMSFVGLRKAEDRTNLIAYLATFLEEAR